MTTHMSDARFARTWSRRVAPTVLMLVLALAWASIARAQTNERLFEGLDFRFVTPGARAVGMGVTFVGLADDATAAATNPAGLSNLRAAEVSVEVLGSDVRERYLVGNMVQGTPCSPPCDVFRTVGRTRWVVPSFASVAVPAGDFTWALFLNSQQRVDRRFQLEPRYVPAVVMPFGVLGPTLQTGESGRLDVTVRNVGAGGAWAVRPWLSVGGSLVASHLRLDSEGQNLEDGRLRSRTRTAASVVRPSAFAGVLVRPSRRTAVGFAYYGGARFPMRTEIEGTFGNPAGTTPPDRCLNRSFARPDRACDPQPPLDTDYVVPTRIALGASYRARDNLTIVAEAARVRYSTLLTDRFQIVDFRFTGNLSREDFFYDDATEYHAGLEYRWGRANRVLAARAGVFTDPGHSLRFRANGPSSADAVEHFVFNVQGSRATRIGATAGAGLTFGNRLQADVALSAVAGTRRIVVSMVRRFP